MAPGSTGSTEREREREREAAGVHSGDNGAFVEEGRSRGVGLLGRAHDRELADRALAARR